MTESSGETKEQPKIGMGEQEREKASDIKTGKELVAEFFKELDILRIDADVMGLLRSLFYSSRFTKEEILNGLKELREAGNG
ncbi:hypothetical protein CEE36_03255 [candidate division TA06 bacterium B3_TA06]|uniref:Uncharacterized protein n=1 Tax=candidate division TA06 bacterium B3_TA06 TaxID=2012487 RepID=A0A532V9Q3_UNCT6|nr:MAG: hypothetical protein CEE36_03255 [candidate division TA06 bacterium B3_TA06]